MADAFVAAVRERVEDDLRPVAHMMISSSTYDVNSFLEVDTKKLRREAALSQQELAELAGTTQETIPRLERGGHHAARGRTLRSLAGALGVEPKELMKSEE